jgi:hypothetical protein
MVSALIILVVTASGDRPFAVAVPEAARDIINEANFVEAFRLGAEAAIGAEFDFTGRLRPRVLQVGDFPRDLWRRTHGGAFGIARYPVLG